VQPTVFSTDILILITFDIIIGMDLYIAIKFTLAKYALCHWCSLVS